MSEDPHIAVIALLPREASAEERAAFEQMVLEAGEVNPDTLPGLIDRALALAFVRLDGTLVAVGAIKRPYSEHRGHVFTWAKSKIDPKQFEFELGWIYVKPAAQGKRIASRIVEKLMPVLNGALVYATSRVNNDRMHSSLKRFGFQPVGIPYPSKQNEPHIQLFICTQKRKPK
jgi:GNAT superfamily N-acetyltransferase